MLNQSLLPATGSPQAVLASYDLCVRLALTVCYVGWRSLAAELTVASTQVPAVFAGKYRIRAADCIERAERIERTKAARS